MLDKTHIYVNGVYFCTVYKSVAQVINEMAAFRHVKTEGDCLYMSSTV